MGDMSEVVLKDYSLRAFLRFETQKITADQNDVLLGEGHVSVH